MLVHWKVWGHFFTDVDSFDSSTLFAMRKMPWNGSSSVKSSCDVKHFHKSLNNNTNSSVDNTIFNFVSCVWIYSNIHLIMYKHCCQSAAAAAATAASAADDDKSY